MDISSKVFRKLPQGKKDYVHLIPLPKVSPVNDKDGNTENGGMVFSLQLSWEFRSPVISNFR